jgi:hypothetical protein
LHDDRPSKARARCRYRELNLDNLAIKKILPHHTAGGEGFYYAKQTDRAANIDDISVGLPIERRQGPQIGPVLVERHPPCFARDIRQLQAAESLLTLRFQAARLLLSEIIPAQPPEEISSPIETRQPLRQVATLLHGARVAVSRTFSSRAQTEKTRGHVERSQRMLVEG